MSKHRKVLSRAQVPTARTCARCGRGCVSGRFCLPCLLVLRQALSNLVWTWTISISVLAGAGLVAVLVFGRDPGKLTGTGAFSMLATLHTWAQLASLGLVVVLSGCALSALGCLVWLDLRRVYERVPRMATTRRDRRLARLNARTVLAAASQASHDRRTASEAKEPAFPVWCALMALEGLQSACHAAGRFIRGSMLIVGGVLRAVALAGCLGGRSLFRLHLHGRVALRRARPHLRSALRATGRATRSCALLVADLAALWTPRLANAVRKTCRGVAFVAAATGSAAVWALRSLVAALGWSARQAGGALGRAHRGVRPLAVKSTRRVRTSLEAWQRSVHEEADRRRAEKRAAEPVRPAELPVARTTPANEVSCPSCGRTRTAPPPGNYHCSQCGTQFRVEAGAAGLDAVCPGCGRSRRVRHGGAYQCSRCGARFHVTAKGTGFDAACPGCGRTRRIDKTGMFTCSECGCVFEATATGCFVEARCPGCGRTRWVERLGKYECSDCTLQFTVTPTGSEVEARCPACGKHRAVEKLGRFRCGDCGNVFGVTTSGCVVDATCPGCGKTKEVAETGFYQCSDCRTVFTVSRGRTSLPEQIARPAAPSRAGAGRTVAAGRERRRILGRVRATDALRRQPSKFAPEPEPAENG